MTSDLILIGYGRNGAYKPVNARSQKMTAEETKQNLKCFQPIEAIGNLSRHDGENHTFHNLPERVPE